MFYKSFYNFGGFLYIRKSQIHTKKPLFLAEAFVPLELPLKAGFKGGADFSVYVGYKRSVD